MLSLIIGFHTAEQLEAPLASLLRGNNQSLVNAYEHFYLQGY
jgi:hypothetical protein